MPIRVNVIRRAGRKFYEVQWLDPVTGLKKTRSTKEIRKREAERFAARLEESLNNDDKVINVISWTEFRTQYERIVYPQQAYKTQETTRSTLNAIEHIINPSRLSVIDEKQILKFQHAIRNRPGVDSEYSVKRHLTELRKLLRWALRNGYLARLPQIDMPRNVRGMKGRPITTEEFERLLLAVPKILEPHQVDSWQHLLTGLWWSGLRLGEAMKLHWTNDENLTVQFTGRRPMFLIRAHADKGRKDRVLPMAPEFAEFLLQTPELERKGYVFNPAPKRGEGRPLQGWVSKVITRIGRKSGVKVAEKDGRIKHASAHDLRRAFGFRWSQKVLPPVLMELMRHESITTTQEFYVGRNAEVSAEQVWTAYTEAMQKIGNTSGNTSTKQADS